MFTFTSKVYNAYRGGLNNDNKRGLFLVSTAVAFIAVNKSGSGHSADIANTVNILADALDEDGMKEEATFELQRYYENTAGWSRSFAECMLPDTMMESLCQALSNYSARLQVLPSGEHLLALHRISSALRTICSQTNYAEKDLMQRARQHLYIFDVRVKDIEVPSLAAIESTMGALVLAETRLQRAHTTDKDDHMATTALSRTVSIEILVSLVVLSES